jgi:hypothetical protein
VFGVRGGVGTTWAKGLEQSIRVLCYPVALLVLMSCAWRVQVLVRAVRATWGLQPPPQPPQPSADSIKTQCCDGDGDGGVEWSSALSKPVPPAIEHPQTVPMLATPPVVPRVVTPATAAIPGVLDDAPVPKSANARHDGLSQGAAAGALEELLAAWPAPDSGSGSAAGTGAAPVPASCTATGLAATQGGSGLDLDAHIAQVRCARHAVVAALLLMRLVQWLATRCELSGCLAV